MTNRAFAAGSNKSNAQDVERKLIEVEHLLTKPGKCECGEDYSYEGLGVYKCKRCGNVFKNEYGKVRDFVDEYGSTYNMSEIAEMTKVPRRLIDLFVREGKFDTVKKQRRCKECHTPIDKGQYCNRCALRQIKMEMENDNKRRIMGSMRKNDDMKGEMHYINKEKI